MNFDSFSAFIDMGGYGRYVWSAYAIAFVVFVYNITRPILMRKQVIREQKRLQQHLVDGKEEPA